MNSEQIGLHRITPSMLMTYNECPKLFYYRDWLGIKFESDMRHLNFGTSIHAAIDHMYVIYDRNFGGGWEHEVFESVEKEFKEIWKKYPISLQEFNRYKQTKNGSNSLATNPKELHKEMEEDGIAMLKDLWDMKEVLLVNHELDVDKTEIPVKMPLYNPSNPDEQHPIPISMRIDGRTVKDVTVEFKTSSGKYDEDDTRKSLQGRSYAFERFQNYQDNNPKVVYVVLLKNRTKDRVQVIELQYDRSDMESYYHEVGAILQKIANREFDRPLRGHNTYCDCNKYEKLLTV